MLTRYREILTLPGAWQFCVAGVVARLPVGMTGLSIVMLISMTYGVYGLAGATTSAYVLAMAVGTPRIGRLVDQWGQARVMVPCFGISAAALGALAAAGAAQAPGGVLVGLAAIAGASQGSITSLIRARWTYVARDARQLHTAYAMEASLDEVSFMLGPVLATWLATMVAPWLPLAVVAAVQAIGGWSFVCQRATQPPPAGAAGAGRSSLLHRRLLWVPLATYALLGVIFGGVDVSTVAFATGLGQAVAAGPALLVFSLGSFLAGFVYGARTWPGRTWMHFVAGTVLISLGTGSFFLVGSVPVLAVVMFITGLTLSPTFVAAQTLVVRIVGTARVTEGMAWMATAINIGVAAGSSLAGIALDRVGSHGGFGVCLAGAIGALVVAVVSAPVLRRRVGT